jgi:ADP-ribosyl-[dinitrogen reductase] hydrolase
MPDAAVRRLEMLEVLHRRGLQLLRGTPSIAPSGLFWRLTVSAPGCDDADRWTTGNADDGLSPEALADRCLAEHPALAEAGRGDDPAYAAWWSGAVDLARRGWLPYFHADWPTDDVEGVPLSGPEEGRPVLPWPPTQG